MDRHEPARVADGPLDIRSAGRALAGCAGRVLTLTARSQLRRPGANVGRAVRFADGSTATVYRETALEGRAADRPAVLVVCFRLRLVRSERAHALFRLESGLNTVLFAGFPGFVSKLWMRHDQHGRYRGVYQWDGSGKAVAYVRALWWVLAPVSEPGSIGYAVLPGLDRDEMLARPELAATAAVLVSAPAGGGGDGWWRPVQAAAAANR